MSDDDEIRDEQECSDCLARTVAAPHPPCLLSDVLPSASLLSVSVEQVKHINTVLLSNVSVEEKLRSVESVDSDRFPERLKNIISQIQETLFEANEKNQKSQSNIELLEDEARCVEYENDVCTLAIVFWTIVSLL